MVLGTAANLGYLFYSSLGRAQVIEGFNGFGYTLAELALMDLAVRATPAGSEGLGFSLMMSVRNLALVWNRLVRLQIARPVSLLFQLPGGRQFRHHVHHGPAGLPASPGHRQPQGRRALDLTARFAPSLGREQAKSLHDAVSERHHDRLPL